MKSVALEIYKAGSATEIRAVVNKWEFHDSMMGDQFLQFSIISEKIIEWEVGDYCIFRGQTYTLNYIPSLIQKARTGESGDAYTYDSIKFESYQEELTRCEMLDISPSEDKYIPALGTNYTGSSRFQLFCGEVAIDGATLTPVCALALKIQANLDRMYGRDTWKIHVDTTSTYTDIDGREILVTHTDDKILTFNNTTAAAALAEVNKTFNLNYSVKGREIFIGYILSNLTSDDESEVFAFGYGKGYASKDNSGKALFEIKRIADSQQQIVTRLRALGSTKNMPYRYYNKRYDLPQSLFPTNLQLPSTFLPEGDRTDAPDIEGNTKWAQNNARSEYLRKVQGETNDAYIEKDDDAENCKEGVRESSACWDGSDSNLQEIYPTIEGATFGELRDAGVQDQSGMSGKTAFQPSLQPDEERIDELLAVGYITDGTLVDNANIGDGILLEDGTVIGSIQREAVLDQTGLLYSESNFDYDSAKKYYKAKDVELFSIKDVFPGKYTMSPTGASLNSIYFSTFLYGPIKGSADVGYILSIKAKSKETGKTKTIAKYDSDFITVDVKDFIKEVNLPALPDAIDAEKAKVSSVKVDDFSDVTVTIALKFQNLKVTQQSDDGQVWFYYQVGKALVPKKEDEGKIYDPIYNWAPLGSASNKAGFFHVFIKDMGFDLKACFGSDTPVVAMKSGYCTGREFEIGEDIQKVTYRGRRGYMLTLNRATDSSLNTYYPSLNSPLSAGDRFVLLNIEMPDVYIRMAEVRLLKAATDYLADNCETKFTYQPSLDDIYVKRNMDMMEKEGTPEKSIFWRLYAGLKFTFRGIPEIKDNTETPPLIEITISNVSIKMGDGLTPKVELTLNDKVQQSTLQKISVAVDRIYNGSLFSSGTPANQNISLLLELLRTEGGRLFLSKVNNDTAAGAFVFEKLLTLLGGIKGDESWQIDAAGNARLLSLLIGQMYGIDGEGVGRLRELLTDSVKGSSYTGEDLLTDKGFRLWTDDKGNGRITVDYLNVRKKFTAMMLEIMKTQYSGGNIVMGCAGSVLSKVEGYDSDGKRVLFPSEYDYTNKDEEIDMWAADRASAYAWMEANAEWVDARGGKMSFFLDDADNGNGGIVFFAKEYSSLGNGSHSPALWRETLRECKTGDVYTEMGMTGGDWMVLGLAGWYDADTVSEDEIANRVSYFRCYFLATDGDKQITNDWYVGDQAFCQSLNLAAGTHYNASNKRYWRLVAAVSSRPVEIDGKDYHYIDLSNDAGDYDDSDGREVQGREVYGGRYERIEYIESDGTQRIDTGVEISPEDIERGGIDIEADVEVHRLDNDGQGAIVGLLADLSQVGKQQHWACLYHSGANSLRWYFARNASGNIVSAAKAMMVFDERVSIGISEEVSSRTLHLNDNTATSSSVPVLSDDEKALWRLGQDGMTLTLFARKNHRINKQGTSFVDNYSLYSKAKLYGLSIRKPHGGRLVRDYVAVRDTLTQEVGLWDRVEGKFYGKDAGNDFAAGAAVEIEKTIVDMPQADDEVVQLGNSTDTNRQSAIQLVVNGENSPKIEGLAGINDFKLDSTQRVFMFSPDGVKVRSNLFRLVTGDSESVVSRWCGKWDVGRKYYVDDEVSHNGGTWVCLADHTGVEPSEENAYYWAVKVRAAGDTNIKGVADYICDTAEEAHAYVDGLREVPFNGIVLLNDPDDTGMKAVRWVRSMIVSPSSPIRWYGIPHSTNDAYIYNDHIYIYDGTWQDRGEWHIRGADGKDAQLMVLEPSGLVLAQNIVVNGDQATYQWVPAKTTVRYVKGDRQEDVTITGVRWENLPDTSFYPFRHSISGNTITFRGLSKAYEGKGFYNMIYRGFVGVRANDGYEEEIPIQVAVQSAGRFSEVIMGDMKEELAKKNIYEWDEETKEYRQAAYLRYLFSTSAIWQQSLTKDDGTNYFMSTIKQTADEVQIGYFGKDVEKASLTINKDGSTFVGTVQSKPDDGGTYAWQLNQDGSGHVGNGGISWERNGDVTVGGRVNGMLMRKATVINSDNWQNYIFQEELGGDYFIDYMKTGSYIILDSSLNSNGSFSSLGLSLPSLPLQGPYTAEKYEEEAKFVREHIGTKIMLYNYSNIGVDIDTYLQPYVYKIKDGKYDKIETGIVESVTVGLRQYASLECVCETAARKDNPSEPNMEMVVWACFSANMSKAGDYEDMIITGQ